MRGDGPKRPGDRGWAVFGDGGWRRTAGRISRIEQTAVGIVSELRRHKRANPKGFEYRINSGLEVGWEERPLPPPTQARATIQRVCAVNAPPRRPRRAPHLCTVWHSRRLAVVRDDHARDGGGDGELLRVIKFCLHVRTTLAASRSARSRNRLSKVGNAQPTNYELIAGGALGAGVWGAGEPSLSKRDGWSMPRRPHPTADPDVSGCSG